MIVGIVAAKKRSKRFAHKNIFPLDGKPLFWHSVQPLLDSKLVDDVYVTTNSEAIAQYCEDENVSVIWRNINAANPDDKLINVIRFAYYSIPRRYDIIVRIMANCPGHTIETVDNTINLLKNKHLQEARSFNKSGEESGIAVYTEKIMETNKDVSYYMGATIDNVEEIHHRGSIK